LFLVHINSRKLKKYPNGLILNKDKMTERFDINSKFLISILKSIAVHISPNIIKKTRLCCLEFEYNFSDCPDIAQTVAVTCFGLGIKATLNGLNTLKYKESILYKEREHILYVENTFYV
jgi:5-enolpyruvylshikimate-3-phosphate synthase